MAFDRTSPFAQSLSLLILDQHIRVECNTPDIAQLLVAAFEAMAVGDTQRPPVLKYTVKYSVTSPRLSLSRSGQTPFEATDLDDLLFLLEKDIVIEVQKRRSDLFFLHSAAVDWQGHACLLAADSGRGKSTTTWALLHNGFQYLSDELSPIDLDALRVYPYPHALCLKHPPPAYPLPSDAIDLGRTIHVPARCLPSAVVAEPRSIRAVFVVDYRADLKTPEVQPISRAEASARLYATALNALAHPNLGLDAAVRIADQVPCFALAAAELPATCSMIRSTLEQATSCRWQTENVSGT